MRKIICILALIVLVLGGIVSSGCICINERPYRFHRELRFKPRHHHYEHWEIRRPGLRFPRF